MNPVSSYEKLGLFYLGKELAMAEKESSGLPLLYKSKNLTTHGVIIGMTGSGKTGLGVGLIEEAIMDDIPSIIIDPKGDMANLLLTFPKLQAADFAPWVDAAEASRKDMTVDQYAEQTAQTWRKGLESWQQGPVRIASLRQKTTMTVYTPGSSSGIPLSILSGFTAPAPDILADHDTLNSLVGSAATSLLSLIDINDDPLTSREHILISSILLDYWRKGKDITLESLIGAIVNPPFEKVGVFGLANFFPQADRMKLAMLINNVIASPSFAAWLQGEPLDIQHILYGQDGRPRTAIFSISHLSESERMFFVTLLLNAIIGWMRRQQGTSSLKALLYMDEIFGFFPPLANPPSKKPMLLLLKQARAYGLGVVLATQNPVDLDYKGLSNIGTWFVGRLQTSQDQNRVLDGIVGSSDGLLDRSYVKNLLADMKGRQFLLTSAHLDEPALFETRWVMSYLKGPVSLQDIGTLMQGRQVLASREKGEAATKAHHSGRLQDRPPLLSEAIDQRYYLPPLLSENYVFQPWLAGTASVRFYNARRNIDELKSHNVRLYLDESFDEPQWQEAELSEINLAECADTPPLASSFFSLPEMFSSCKDLKAIEKGFADYLYQNKRLELLRAPSLKLESRPGETETEFSVRIADYLKEKKELAAEKVLGSFQLKRQRLEKRLDSALLKIDKEKSDVSSKTADTFISFGTAVLGAFFGRKALSASTVTRTASSIKKAGLISKEKADVRRAEEAVTNIEADIEQLQFEQDEAIAKIADKYDPIYVETETFTINPRRNDIFDVRVSILWEMEVPAIKSKQV